MRELYNLSSKFYNDRQELQVEFLNLWIAQDTLNLF
jgi:hypothetical protein